jgi:hypothetical protein
VRRFDAATVSVDEMVELNNPSFGSTRPFTSQSRGHATPILWAFNRQAESVERILNDTNNSLILIVAKILTFQAFEPPGEPLRHWPLYLLKLMLDLAETVQYFFA